MKNLVKILVFLLLALAVILMFYFATQSKYFKGKGGEAGGDFSPKQTEQIQKIVHKYLLDNPKILLEVNRKLKEKEVEEEKAKLKETEAKIPKHKKEIFDNEKLGKIILGNPNGKIIIAEFTQHQCPSCKKTALILHKMLEKNPDIKLIVVYWPFLGGSATHTAKSVLAATKQNKAKDLDHAFFSHEDYLTKEKSAEVVKAVNDLDEKKLSADMGDKGIIKGLQNNFKLAQKLGFTGTPTLIITNEKMEKFIFMSGQTNNFEKDLEKAIKEMR